MIDRLIKFLQRHFAGYKPETLIILGSGLGAFVETLADKKSAGFDEAGFPASSVSGHAGKFVAGRLEGRDVLCMQGRFHLYEGHSPVLIKEMMCAFAAFGIKELIVTNAAGSLNPDIPVGSLMLIKDHINFSARNPLVGIDDCKYGPRFPDMGNAYDCNLREKIKSLAFKRGIELYEGVYFMVLGPNFETAAEVKAFRLLGGDAAGMSTVPEVIAAVYSGIKVLGLSVITNMGTGIQAEAQSHEETLARAGEACARLVTLLKLYFKGE